MSSVLRERFGFDEADLEILRNQEATRDAILAAMDRLVERTRPQDVVFLHFSGHGSEVVDREGDEPSGKDQTIVAYDSGRLTKPNRDITDDEIFDRLRRLAAKTDRITLLFDCCHWARSTATRSAKSPARSNSTTGPATSSRPPRSRRHNRGRHRLGATSKGARGRRPPLPIDGSYVLMAGCRDEEKSFEHRARQGAGQVQHGALTYFLLARSSTPPPERPTATCSSGPPRRSPHPTSTSTPARWNRRRSWSPRPQALLGRGDGLGASSRPAAGARKGPRGRSGPSTPRATRTPTVTPAAGLVEITAVDVLKSEANIVETIRADAIGDGTSRRRGRAQLRQAQPGGRGGRPHRRVGRCRRTSGP
ncbi:MAG: caspase family protein [Singulisphaera sp.]